MNPRRRGETRNISLSLSPCLFAHAGFSNADVHKPEVAPIPEGGCGIDPQADFPFCIMLEGAIRPLLRNQDQVHGEEAADRRRECREHRCRRQGWRAMGTD